MASVSYKELQANWKKQQEEVDAQLAPLGYKKIGDRYVKVPTAMDTQGDVLNNALKALELQNKMDATDPEKVKNRAFIEAEAKAKAEAAFPPAKENRVINVLDSLNKKISDLANKVNTSRFKNPLKGLAARFQLDTNAAELDSLTEAFATQYARFLSGESGNLSDVDIKRIKKALPGPGESKQVTKRKLDNLANLLEVARAKNSTQQSVSPTSNSGWKYLGAE